MKKAILAIASLLFLAASFAVSAGPFQEVTRSGGFCHFAYDINNADNEVKESCIVTINYFDAGDGLGRLATGVGEMTVEYHVIDGTIPNFVSGHQLKGRGADSNIFGDEYAISPFACIISEGGVPHATLDWQLEITQSEPVDGKILVAYRQPCRNGVAQQ